MLIIVGWSQVREGLEYIIFRLYYEIRIRKKTKSSKLIVLDALLHVNILSSLSVAIPGYEKFYTLGFQYSTLGILGYLRYISFKYMQKSVSITVTKKWCFI